MVLGALDLAGVLVDAVRNGTCDEAHATCDPCLSAFVHPPRAVFTVETIEGKRFQVVVDELQ